MLRAVVLEPAFWGGKLREGSDHSVFLLSSHVKKVGRELFLYYCCWWHNCYIILEPFEKPVPSSVAWFPLCSVECRAAWESTGFSQCPEWERGDCLPNFQRRCQSLHKQHRLPRSLIVLFLCKELTSALETWLLESQNDPNLKWQQWPGKFAFL